MQVQSVTNKLTRDGNTPTDTFSYVCPVFIFFRIMKSSYDALDGLLGADQWGAIEAKLDNSFKIISYGQNMFSKPKIHHESTPRPNFDIMPIHST